MSNPEKFRYTDDADRLLVVHELGSSIFLTVVPKKGEGINVRLDRAAFDAMCKSLAPVVGAEGGEQARNDSALPVASAEPGPGGTHDGPGRASIEENDR